MANLTLKYDAGLPHQIAAIASVVGLFAGQPLAGSSFTGTTNLGSAMLTEFGVGNRLVLGDDALLANLQSVQTAHGIDPARALGGRDFTVEMETGTGKTYVYLRTAFELNRTYGLRKFVIVVPSIAIREGVLHSIRTMGDHFRTLYNAPFDQMTYDGRQLGRLRSFATANTLQLLVINIQAFQRDVKAGGAGGEDGGGRGANVIYRENDRLSGHRPIDFLRATRPIVILDEPQKLAGEASARAIAQLDPLCTLQYSATPDKTATRIYRLGPIEAMENRLVKRIEVASVREESNANDAYVRLLKVDAAKQSAQVEMNVGNGSTMKTRTVTIRGKDDLFLKSQGGRLDAGRQEYHGGGYRVAEISFRPDDSFVEFANGHRITLGQATGGLDDEVMRAQVRETVREHFDKERRLRPRGIKVLSLFFIDRVANYRQYPADGTAPALGKIGRWFEEAYAEFGRLPQYTEFASDPVERVHDGYFATDRKGGYRDSVEGRGNSDDEGAYVLIMQAKERLLSLGEPLRFIFSHSALREGWDNPNVFQICTLNETMSVTRKRQEIGRGLRLPVDQGGQRIHDPSVNRLTVVANESYREFAQRLQEDYEADGIVFGVIGRAAFANLVRTDSGDGQVIGLEGSNEIWEALRFKGLIDGQGRIQRSFDSIANGYEILSGDEFKGMEAQVVDAVTDQMITSRVDDARQRRRVDVQPQVIDDPAFQKLWDHVSQRTRFELTFDTARLIERAVARIRDAAPIEPVRIAVDTHTVDVSRKGVVGVREARRLGYGEEVALPKTIPDILADLQNETDLTRDTLVDILLGSGRLPELTVNPQAFITMTTREIKGALTELMIPGIRYEPILDDQWELDRLRRDGDAGIEPYLNRLYKLRRPGKSPFPYVEFDSRVEEQFARELDENEEVRFFVKLPDWFTVDTPVGTYNPDWAILIEGSETLYLVRETKSTLNADERRPAENVRIACARKHFAAIDVGYEVTTDLAETIRSLRRSASRD